MRSEAKKNILTVKTIESASIDRGEWEKLVKSKRLVAHDIAASPAASVLGQSARDLKPAFATDVERTKAMIAYKSANVEMALDQGTIIAGKRKLADLRTRT